MGLGHSQLVSGIGVPTEYGGIHIAASPADVWSWESLRAEQSGAVNMATHPPRTHTLLADTGFQAATKSMCPAPTSRVWGRP